MIFVREGGITDAAVKKNSCALLFSVEKSASAPMHNTIFLKGILKIMSELFHFIQEGTV